MVQEWNINQKQMFSSENGAGSPAGKEKLAERIRYCPACGAPFLKGKGFRPPGEPPGEEHCQESCAAAGRGGKLPE